ncbi:ATP-binding cassette domain-containing protein [Paenibacillus caseinilyticus]|uniref:Acetoin ABC transporter ATP-binding protein n=1 Tax=Paenibacillus mucilaginosus K02 TaxID=997761 RepID=I0BIU4_9BACL|nr:ABC transporter ATP-binding protein [Paenibacillus mucilaginosus]AFH62291.1 acetoin ABC transporter ATP-binding protein [Paenibacillus mucilaginosus K02]
MLTVRNLNKQIDGKRIIENVSFDIAVGTITGLIGRNGVGKSTLLRLLAGILDPDKGEIRLNGSNLTDHPLNKNSMFYVPDSTSMFNGYTVQDLVRFHRSMYDQLDERSFYHWLNHFQLPANRKIRSFSKGMKALLFMILALSTRAKLILLDEPTNGLDVIVNKQIMQLLIEEVSDRQISVIMSSHHLQELEKIADIIMFMKGATIDSIIRIDEVRQSYRKLQVAFADSSSNPWDLLPQVEVLTQVGRVTTLLVKSDVKETLQLLQESQPLLLEELPITIEDIFISKLGGDQYVS